MDDLTQHSKYLAYLLRHRPDIAGLTLDREGWCDVEELLSKTTLSRKLLLSIVELDEKRRYTLSPDAKRIRANQGHSVKDVKLTFKKAVPPVVLYHGTSAKALGSILKQGLRPMKRHHVHLSSSVDVARSVGGRRKEGAIILRVDAKSMLADGHSFYLSDNDVWLVDHVDVRYIQLDHT